MTFFCNSIPATPAFTKFDRWLWFVLCILRMWLPVCNMPTNTTFRSMPVVPVAAWLVNLSGRGSSLTLPIRCDASLPSTESESAFNPESSSLDSTNTLPNTIACLARIPAIVMSRPWEASWHSITAAAIGSNIAALDSTWKNSKLFLLTVPSSGLTASQTLKPSVPFLSNRLSQTPSKHQPFPAWMKFRNGYAAS